MPVMISGFLAPAIQSADVLDIVGMRHGRTWTGPPHTVNFGAARHPFGQNFARQTEIHRPLRRRRCNFHRPVHGGCRLIAAPHLIVPLDQLAQHAGLVEHFLRPLNMRAARSLHAAFGIGGAAGGQQHRYAVAARVDQHIDRVGCSNIGVQHHRLRPPGHRGVAVRHGDRDTFMRNEHRPRHLPVAAGGTAIRLDHRRKIGARIDEQVLNAVCGKQVQIVFRGDPAHAAIPGFPAKPQAISITMNVLLQPPRGSQIMIPKNSMPATKHSR